MAEGGHRIGRSSGPGIAGELRVEVLLLAGGRSKRLGRDKRFLTVDRRSLLERGLWLAKALCASPVILISDPEEEALLRERFPLPFRVQVDPVPGAGPLGALAGALSKTECDYGLLLAVDYPLMSRPFLLGFRSYLDSLGMGPAALVPVWRGRPQYACAFYHRRLAGPAWELFVSGERSLRGLIDALEGGQVLFVGEETWRQWSGEEVFLNLNTPADLERLRELGASCHVH